MYLQLAIKDLKATIKNNKTLFILFILGLFFVSLLSMLFTETMRQELIDINAPKKQDGYLTFKYETPKDAIVISEALKKLDNGTYSLYLITETAYKNNPYYYEVISTYTASSAPSKLLKTPPEEVGIVGYKASELSIERPVMESGSFLSSRKNDNRAVITNSTVPLMDKSSQISAEGHTLSVCGVLDLFESGVFAFSSRNAIVSTETFEALDMKAIIVFLHFKARPSEKFLSRITDALNALGDNVNTSNKVGTFEWGVIFQYITSSVVYIAVITLLFLILILSFKCWISAQQSMLSVYYLCGMNDKISSLLRNLQLFLCITPIYILATITSITLTYIDYKKYTYTVNISSIIVNYLFILLIACIISSIQARKVKSFTVLKNL